MTPAAPLRISPIIEDTMHAAGIAIVDPHAAQKLVRHAELPFLVLRDAAPFERWLARERPLRVVLGWDPSATTVSAQRLIRALRATAPIDVIVTHVYFPDEAAAQYGLHHVTMVDRYPDLEAMIERDIDRHLGDLRGGGNVSVVAMRGVGRVGDHLVQAAERVGADLLVVGSHHRRGLRRLTSVSSLAIKDAPMSVLCVPRSGDAIADPVATFRTIAVALDGSELSAAAVPYAYAACPEGGEVHLIRVVDGDDTSGDAAKITAMLALRPPDRAGVVLRAHVVHERDAARGIAATAERVGADVVCVASPARSAVASLVAPTLAERVLHVSRRPVLVVHPVD